MVHHRIPLKEKREMLDRYKKSKSINICFPKLFKTGSYGLEIIDQIYQYNGIGWDVVAYLNVGRSNHAVSVVKTDNLFNLCKFSFSAPVAPTSSG